MSKKSYDVFVFDDLSPEDTAMIQALYSRSPASVLDHRKKVAEVGSGKFMSSFYLNYGHASIADCGDTTIFVENVSMLVAKAIQDSGLYNGQEASTRYLDFSIQPMYDPYNHEKSQAILDRWMSLYTEYMPLAIEGLKVHHPFNPETDKSEKIWEKTIKVRAFDTLRCFLPVGTTTLLSWQTSLRHARDHLRDLVNHPLEEVQRVAQTIYRELLEKYPNSFNYEDINPLSERFMERNQYAQDIDNFYLSPNKFMEPLTIESFTQIQQGVVGFDLNRVDVGAINNDTITLARPRGARLPRRMKQHGVYNARFLLDFGSFRDLQRHRDGYCPIPLITSKFGFHSWYLHELECILTEDDYSDLVAAIDTQLHAIDTLATVIPEANDLSNQYLFPMGIACGCTTSYTLNQMVYVSEMRSNKTVHQSLRPIAQSFGKMLEVVHPNLSLYIDYDEDSFTTKRGEQDIVAKEKTDVL